MASLRETILSCQACPLYRERNLAVFGEGPENAPLMVIGEGPGAKEDELGRPFVGRAGKLLDQMMEQAGLSREKNAFIANIVKCRPPKNRVPKKQEVQTCFPYLEEQIELVNPKLILLLGATALKSYRGTPLRDKISDIRGSWEKENNRLVMATFHPAAVFRNPRYKPFIEEDLQAIADKLKETAAG